MAKGFCISGILISALVLVIFLIDLLLALAGLESLAPFRGASRLMDIVFVICAVGLGFASWSTLKEQV